MFNALLFVPGDEESLRSNCQRPVRILMPGIELISPRPILGVVCSFFFINLCSVSFLSKREVNKKVLKVPGIEQKV